MLNGRKRVTGGGCKGVQFAVEAAQNPAGAVDGSGVAEGFVAGGFGCGASVVGDVAVAIGEVHEAFALEG